MTEPSAGATGSGSKRSFGPRFDSALVFAAQQHFGQIRKGNGAPYISHPLAVMALVADYGGDEDQAIAALLHDTLEDCGVAADELRGRYGTRVAEIVSACTDTTERPKPPWRPRKEAFLERLRDAPAHAKLVVAADKLHNARCILRDLRRPTVGNRVWERFRAPRHDQLWYFASVVDALAAGWKSELLDELRRVVAQLA